MEKAMSKQKDGSALPARKSWHMIVVTGYLALSGLWTWALLCYVVIWRKLPVGPNAFILFQLFLLSAAWYAAAYALYICSKFSIVAVAAILALQWSYMVYFTGITGFSLDIHYIRQLPPLLLCNTVVQIAIVVYTACLWKIGRLS